MSPTSVAIHANNGTRPACASSVTKPRRLNGGGGGSANLLHVGAAVVDADAVVVQRDVLIVLSPQLGRPGFEDVVLHGRPHVVERRGLRKPYMHGIVSMYGSSANPRTAYLRELVTCVRTTSDFAYAIRTKR